MRVISQEGTLDFPYELSAIRINNEVITMSMCEETAYRSVVARYSTEAKAGKAVEMLRKAYDNNVFYHHTSTTDVFKDVASLMSNEEFNKLTSEYFQFPQDDEIEV